jgi:hypothetical protein
VKYRYCLVFIYLICGSFAYAQYNPKDICRVENDRIIFKLDNHWTIIQKREVARLFDLDSLLMDSAFEGKKDLIRSGIEWKVRKLNDHVIELSKVLGKAPVSKTGKNEIFMVDDRWVQTAGIQERLSVNYGINNFTLNSVFHYNNGVAWFYLPEHKDARQVYLSGSFNNWSTLQTPMQISDSGWVVSLPLKPGKYSYKYIIDGKWNPDLFNKLKEKDTYHGYNSILFCYNYHFKLKGYKTAHTVILTGSFNNWNERELKMISSGDGWVLPLYLREGTHAYKFIVDKQWITDPGNKLTRPDGAGNYNSVIGIGDSLFFRLRGFTTAKNVILTGNFNAWNTGELFMEKVRDGWQLAYVLPAGNYEYKFIVDGKWMIDPANSYIVGSGDFQNSFLPLKANHFFRLDRSPNAKKVIVTGSFNEWNNEGYQMVKKNDEWIFPLYLIPGKYTYKFIVDGQWIIDPDNDLWENNEYGTKNSILWIEP